MIKKIINILILLIVILTTFNIKPVLALNPKGAGGGGGTTNRADKQVVVHQVIHLLEQMTF